MDKLEGLRNKLLELQTENADARVAIEELQAELDKLEQDAKTRSCEAMLWPQVADEYWCVDEAGHIWHLEWLDNDVDHYRLATGNCHRTKAEALAYRAWQTDPRVVARGMIERMEGADPSGIFIIRQESHYPSVAQSSLVPYDGGLRFSEMWSAQAVVDKHPDLCKVALGVITDKVEAGRIVRLAIGNASDSGEAIGK